MDLSKRATKFREGACTNCGAMTHKKKDCLEVIWSVDSYKIYATSTEVFTVYSFIILKVENFDLVQYDYINRVTGHNFV